MSPLVALFFAVENNDLADAALWAVAPGQLNFEMVGEFRLMVTDDAKVRELVKLAYEVDPKQHAAMSEIGSRVLAVSTREVDPRVMVQQGAFTIHADGGDMALMDMASEERPWLIGFRIPRDAKQSLRELLRQLAITRSTLFPYLGSLAHDLKQRLWLTGIPAHNMP